jgi:hypothetical protein
MQFLRNTWIIRDGTIHPHPSPFERITSVSNSSRSNSSQVLLRISPAAMIFVVMMLVVGGLLLASNGIDERALQRAQVAPTATGTPAPIDPFAYNGFVTFTSEDGLISFEHPDSWTVAPAAQRGPVAYVSVADPTSTRPDQPGLLLYALPRQLVMQGAAADASTETMLQEVAAQNPLDDGTTVPVEAVEAGGLSGHRIHLSSASLNQQTGELLSTDDEIWLLSLDSTNVLVLQARSGTNDWQERMQPILDRFRETLTVDVAGVVAAINNALGVTPEAAPDATVEATTEPTVEATPEATTEPTAEATIEATSEAVAEPTAEATDEAFVPLFDVVTGGSAEATPESVEPTTEPTSENF